VYFQGNLFGDGALAIALDEVGGVEDHKELNKIKCKIVTALELYFLFDFDKAAKVPYPMGNL
jgi:predicted Ser/Thr protein kinase